MTYSSALSQANSTGQAALYLAQVNNALDSNNLKHSIIVRWLLELIVSFEAPWSCTTCPTKQTKYRLLN